jgi:hypothetical protein
MYLHNCANKQFFVLFRRDDFPHLCMRFSFLNLRTLFRSARPARDIFAALALKGVLLLAIYLLFFGPAHRLPSDATATAKALIGAFPSKDAP